MPRIVIEKERKSMNIGIIGAGNIASKMAVTVNGLKDITLYAIASRSEDRAQTFAEKYGAKKYYGSYEDMLKDDNVELVYIATPHSEHYDNAMLCISYKKPVLCEKAFTANAFQAKKVFDYAHKERVFITEAIWTRYMPMVGMIKDVIEKGMIGEPKMLSANLSYPIEDKRRNIDPALAGGCLLDLGVYPINFAFIFFGDDIKTVTSDCVISETGVDSQETVTIHYNDGRMACLNASQQCLGDRKGMIHGTKGYIVIENINNYESFKVYDNNYNIIMHEKAPAQITGYEYEVLACKRAISEGKYECDEMPHTESIKIMEFMDALRKEWGIKFPFE